jgi:hypothetical protein
MIRADGFAVRVLSPPTNEAEPICRLSYQGRDTGRDLPAAVLEAALEVDGEWLLFLTHDVPFEETLGIFLLGSNFDVLDRVALMAPNATGAFKSLRILSDRRVRFNFLGEQGWELELMKKPAFRLPLVSEPLGVVRPFGFSRRFALSRTRER